MDRKGDSWNSALTWTTREPGQNQNQQNGSQLLYWDQNRWTGSHHQNQTWFYHNLTAKASGSNRTSSEAEPGQNLTRSSSCSARSPGSSLRPAVAFRTTGVLVHWDGGTTERARSNSATMPAEHCRDETTHHRSEPEPDPGLPGFPSDLLRVVGVRGQARFYGPEHLPVQTGRP